METFSNLLFISLLTVAISFAYVNFKKIRRNIFLGKPEHLEKNPRQRIKMMLLVAFGQKKMFDRPIAALLHFFVYAGFIIINIEMLEIILDGISGKHRLFSKPLGSFYPFLIGFFEFFAVSVIISCVIFLIRRYVLKINRFQSIELNDVPQKDATTILLVEIILMLAFLTMNAADLNLQTRGLVHYPDTNKFLVSQFLSSFFNSFETSNLIFVERSAWWIHIVGVFIFLNYLPFSKHLHILLAFPTTYLSNLESKGKMSNMPSITEEVKLILGLTTEGGAEKKPEVQRFGAKDVQDLSWKNLLEAYTCTECGRCTSVCPANLTGKALSPRKIMMDTRDRLEEVGKNIDQHKPELNAEKTLLGDYITSEELLACTTCNACVEACPINLRPLDIILQLRRYKIMEESEAPTAWNNMFSTLETNGSPWRFSPRDRANWMNETENN
jgi:heterodisulfide reductase subunit C